MFFPCLVSRSTFSLTQCQISKSKLHLSGNQGLHLTTVWKQASIHCHEARSPCALNKWWREVEVGLSSRLSHNPALTDLHRSIVTPSACQGCTPGPLFGRHLLLSLQTWTWGQESMKRNRRKEGNGGPKSLENKGALFMAVCAYILLYNETLGRKIKLSKKHQNQMRNSSN